MTAPAILAISNHANAAPCGGPKHIPFTPDFSAASSYDYDFSNQIQDNTFPDPQGIYIDNSNNTSPVTVTVQATNHRVICPGQSQGYFLLLFTGTNGKVTFSSTGNVKIAAFIYNTPVMPAVWSAA